MRNLWHQAKCNDRIEASLQQGFKPLRSDQSDPLFGDIYEGPDLEIAVPLREKQVVREVNSTLKRLVAEPSLDNQILQDIARGNF